MTQQKDLSTLTANDLVGAWHATEGCASDGVRRDYALRLNPDGTWSAAGTSAAGGTSTRLFAGGSWRFEKGVLICSAARTSGDPRFAGHLENVLLFDDGEVCVYRRGDTRLVLHRAESAAADQLRERQERLSLALIAYTGMWGKAAKDPARLLELMRGFLESIASVRGRFSIVWGPAIGRSTLNFLTNDHVAYVVEDSADPGRLVVVIRGTNPLSIENVILEVDNVFELSSWPYGQPASSQPPRMAAGMHRGLGELLALSAADGIPGAGKTLVAFLRDRVAAAQGEVSVAVTGHSLGGSLSSTLALYLRDTQGVADGDAAWDPDHRAAVSCTSIAGFSAGDGAFAAYSDARIGGAVDRVFSSLDVIPCMYAADGLESVKTLYAPTIETSKIMVVTLDLILHVFKSKGISYRQINAGAAALQSSLRSGKHSFTDEMMWQHVDGYIDLLGLHGVIDVKAILEAH